MTPDVEDTFYVISSDGKQSNVQLNSENRF